MEYKHISVQYYGVENISKILIIGQSSVLKTYAQYCFPYILVVPCCTELGLNLKHDYGCHL